MKKPDVMLLFGENCVILKKFSEPRGEGARKRSLLKNEEKPWK
jgi:hypothetical protein